MTLDADAIDELIRANARALNLSIAPEYVPGVRSYLRLAAQMAELVDGLELGVRHESGSVFIPVAPASTAPAAAATPAAGTADPSR